MMMFFIFWLVGNTIPAMYADALCIPRQGCVSAALVRDCVHPRQVTLSSRQPVIDQRRSHSLWPVHTCGIHCRLTSEHSYQESHFVDT